MPSANSRLRDYLLSRQVGIQRLSLRHQRYMQRLLEAALRDANRELRRRLELIRLVGFDRGPVVTQQIDQTIGALNALLSESYRQMGDKFGQRMLDLAAAETEATRAAIRRAVPNVIEIAWAFPGESVLAAIVKSDPMQGHAIGSYFAKTTKPSLVKRALQKYRATIREEVAAGLLRSEGVDKVTRRVAAKVRGVARWQLRNVVDTATKHVTQTARQKFLEANSGDDGVVKGYQWLSTFDLHTTKEWCIPRSGRQYDRNFQPIGHGYEWGAGPGRIHWGCRSGMTSVLKSWKELGLPGVKELDEVGGIARAGEHFQAGNVRLVGGRYQLIEEMDGRPAVHHDNVRDWLLGREWSHADYVEMFGARRAARIESGDLTVRGALRQVGVRA